MTDWLKISTESPKYNCPCKVQGIVCYQNAWPTSFVNIVAIDKRLNSAFSRPINTIISVEEQGGCFQILNERSHTKSSQDIHSLLSKLTQLGVTSTALPFSWNFDSLDMPKQRFPKKKYIQLYMKQIFSAFDSIWHKSKNARRTFA